MKWNCDYSCVLFQCYWILHWNQIFKHWIVIKSLKTTINPVWLTQANSNCMSEFFQSFVNCLKKKKLADWSTIEEFFLFKWLFPVRELTIFIFISLIVMYQQLTIECFTLLVYSMFNSSSKFIIELNWRERSLAGFQ